MVVLRPDPGAGAERPAEPVAGVLRRDDPLDRRVELPALRAERDRDTDHAARAERGGHRPAAEAGVVHACATGGHPRVVELPERDPPQQRQHHAPDPTALARHSAWSGHTCTFRSYSTRAMVPADQPNRAMRPVR